MIDGRGTTRAEDAQGTPTQSHISPSILVYENEKSRPRPKRGRSHDYCGAMVNHTRVRVRLAVRRLIHHAFNTSNVHVQVVHGSWSDSRPKSRLENPNEDFHTSTAPRILTRVLDVPCESTRKFWLWVRNIPLAELWHSHKRHFRA